VCLCVELDVEERWQQYWRDYGEQLVLKHWHSGYINHDSRHSATELPDTQSTCQSSVHADLLENGSKVSESNKCEAESAMTDEVNGITGCMNATNLEECYLTADGENQVEEAEELLVDSSRNVESSPSAENHSLAAGDLKSSATVDQPVTKDQQEEAKELLVDSSRSAMNNGSNAADDVLRSSDQAIACDGVDMCDDRVNEQSSWDALWEQHYADTYWYYYEWFMQYVNEPRQSDTAYPTDDIQQLSSCYGEVVSSSRSSCVGASCESLDIVQCLLTDLLLSAVDSLGRVCPADGNGRKQRKHKKARHNEHGLSGVSRLSVSDFAVVFVPVCDR